ncbi:MAG: ABC transporter permease [bacterium]|nr:ABC transporter permease [bacterium]
MLKIQLVGLITLVRKETTRIFRIWSQTILPPVITTTLYFLVFGNFIGNRIGELDGVSYMQFIVPGLIMMGILVNSFMNVVSTVFSAKFMRQIEEVLVSPMANSVILLGYASGGIIRGCIVGVAIAIISLLFEPLQIQHPVLVAVTIILTATLFSLLGFLNALFARKFDDITIIPTFVLTPLTYLGGVFYSISLLPDFWKKVSLFNPILYLINLFRYGFLGISDVPIARSLIGLLVLTIAVWFIVLSLLKKGKGLRN